MPVVRKVTIDAKVAWYAKQVENAPRWIGVCDELNIATEADSLDELHSLIPESIHLLITDLVKDNEFDAYLREKGWNAIGTPAADDGEVEYDLPWQMITEGSGGSERSAH